MAVFPTARRALARPARLPWLILATTLTGLLLTVLTVQQLRDAAVALMAPSVSVEVVSTAPDEGIALTQPSIVVDNAVSGASLLATEAQEALAIATSSDVLMAAEEAAYAASRQPVAAQEVAVEEAQPTLVAEVSDTAAVAVAPDPAPAAEASTVVETGGTATTSAEPVVSTQPAASTEAVAAPPPVQAPPAPAQPVPAAPSGPIERWAAAGIIIETEGQSLDDASLANIDAALGSLPSGVLNSLGNPAFGPMHILVNTEGRVLSGDQPYGGPANFFSTNEATNELVLYPQQSVFTIIHELGHAYNLRRQGAGRYAMVLLDSEMRSFLTATGWTINSSDDQIRAAVDHMHVSYSYAGSFHWPRLSNDDPLEDFANSFAMYFLDPGSLSQASPERYAWMASTFGR